MIISKQIAALRNSISDLKQEKKDAVVGFVPTMGALHEGHLSLVKKASKQSDIVVVSIFVNPTQFNDKSDLKKYPRTIDTDIQLLENTPCDILFFPSEDVVYPDGEPDYKIDLNGLDKVMEGKFREDHFDGVAMVVERLFEIVQPDKAFFGLKDFQQLAIIQQMVKTRQLDVEIVPCEIVRSPEGLALSSRNALLSELEKKDALIIYKTLEFGSELAQSESDAQVVRNKMMDYFNRGNLKLEYLEIVDPASLQAISKIIPGAHCCIAAYCGSIRLIDNMRLK